MPTSYTSLLGLALPVTGELSGTWGDTVNDYITQYVDAAAAGTQIISGSQTAVTLTVTNGSSLTQVGSGSSGSAQYAVINCTGNPAGLLTITAPASSRQYLIINATSTSQSVKIVGAGPTTGVTLVATESAIVAWNGSDYVKVASSAVDGVSTISFGSTGLTPSTATSGAVTVGGTLAVGSGGTGLTSGTSGGVPYFSATNTLASSAALAASAIVVGGGAGVAPSTITTGTGVTTAIGNAVNTTGGLVTQSGTLTANNVLLGGGASTAISSSNLLSVAAAVTTGNYIRSIGYADTVTALGNTGTAINLDVTSGGVFTATLTGNATITLRYPVATGSSSFTLILTNDGTAGRTVAWAGGSFVFPGGAASLSRTTTANAVDVWVFFTPNGGTTWYGNIAMKDMKA
jgi:hypothetical protein